MRRTTELLDRLLNRMTIRVNSALSQKRAKKRRSALQYRSLEARRLLAVITVDTLSDSLSAQPDGMVSLREAITAANTNAAFGDAPAGDVGTDFIRFATSIVGQTITLDGSEIEITESVVIRGGDPGITIDADWQSRVFTVDTDQRVAFTNLTLSGGHAREGGGVLTRGGGQVQFFGSTVSNNRATAAFSGGGGIFNLDSRVFLANSEVTQNNSHGFGGGVFSADGVVQLFSSKLTSNVAYSGGAVAIAEGAFYSSQSEVSRNGLFYDPLATDRDSDSSGLLGNVLTLDQVNLAGGGIAMLGSSGVSVINSTTISRNSADNGGGIYIDVGNRVYVARNTDISLNRAVGVETSGLSRNGGGGVYNRGLLRMTDVTFTRNLAEGIPTGAGGAILSDGGIVRFNRAVFTGNATDDDGGAIYASDSSLRIMASTFSGNTLARLSGIPHQSLTTPHQSAEGGALFFEGSTNATITGTTFEDNVAGDYGGAISSSATVKVSNSQFLRNTALSSDEAFGNGGGGAIFNRGGTFDLFTSTLTGNKALTNVAFGGAIYSNGGNLNVSISSFFENVSEGSGGAVAITGGDAVVFESTFGDANGRGNFARLADASLAFENNLGGALYVDGSQDDVTSLRLQGTSFIGNRARQYGGGLWAGTHTQIRVFSSSFQPTEFIGNQALAFDGGGAFLRSNDLLMVDAVFAENKSRSGGGIYADGGSLTLNTSQLSTNEARRFGDDLFNDADFFQNSSSSIDDVFEA